MMSNTTIETPQTSAEGVFWAMMTLENFDAWCGSTCHTALRYLLRMMLLVVLIGAFASVLLRCLNTKRSVALSRTTGLDGARRFLGKSELRSVARTFRDAGVGAKMGSLEKVDGEPDVKDSCMMM